MQASPLWRVEMAPKVKKYLLRHHKDLASFLNTLAKILQNPYRGVDTEPLRGENNWYRIKVNGRLRLVYEVWPEKRTIYLAILGHRDDIYSLV